MPPIQMSSSRGVPFLTRHTVTLLIPWSVIIVGLTAILLIVNHRDTIKAAESEARTYHRLNLHYRAWGARLGGVYAALDKVEPNPWLTVPERDITASNGKQLTLINPAYMTRMVFDDIKKAFPDTVVSKLTSLKPLNPENAPDEWERGALEEFSRGSAQERSQILTLNNRPYLRLISRFVTEKPCLKCHQHQGYKEGDIRGGLSISIPLDAYKAREAGMRTNLISGFLVLWMLGSGGIIYTSRRRSVYETQLLEKEERFRIVCDWAQGWEYWVNPAEEIEYVSPLCEEITGYTPHDFYQSRSLTRQIVHPDDRQRFEEHLMVLGDSARPAEQLEFRIIHKNGEVRWIQHECRPVMTDGKFAGRRVSNRDITKQKLAEEERHKLELQMLSTQKLESLGVLAGGIAHDFNNILVAIMGNAELALMRINRESPAVENLHRIEKAAAQAADLAKQMLAYSGKGRFVIENIDLNRLLEEMLHMLEVSITKHAVLRLTQYQPLPSVEADATQMRQIIMNLVINASEAIGDKSGVIAITTGCMDCDHNYLKDVWLNENISEGLYVYLEIADTGCGMDKGIMAKLFDPFFTTKFTGRGLGMAAVLGIVRGHKGAIKVYSEPKKGTTFKILLPASNRPAALFNGANHQDDWQGSGTVLLVDDEETVRGIGAEMLKELGFSVITANDGREAIEVFTKTPDIAFVLLDLTMPHVDGEQCFRELRHLCPDVKVIMCSGYNEQEVTQKFVGKGLAGFIQKPYKLSTLRSTIRKLLV